MKLGDILENKSAGEKNPNRKIIFLREESRKIAINCKQIPHTQKRVLVSEDLW